MSAKEKVMLWWQTVRSAVVCEGRKELGWRHGTA